jgi:hypothetical protein
MLQWQASGPARSPATSKEIAPHKQDPECISISNESATFLKKEAKNF